MSSSSFFFRIPSHQSRSNPGAVLLVMLYLRASVHEPPAQQDSVHVPVHLRSFACACSFSASHSNLSPNCPSSLLFSAPASVLGLASYFSTWRQLTSHKLIRDFFLLDTTSLLNTHIIPPVRKLLDNPGKIIYSSSFGIFLVRFTKGTFLAQFQLFHMFRHCQLEVSWCYGCSWHWFSQLSSYVYWQELSSEQTAQGSNALL